ncbi:MAG: hypothetical protein ACRCT1_03915 [Microcoleaceae cyanobacterium]|jgi:hypothetical protein
MINSNGKKPELSHPKDDIVFQGQVQKLHELTVYTRWLVVILLWLTVGIFSLWGLRDEIALWLQFFTWAAVRYGLAYHRLSAIGLGLCIGMTLGVLIWQSRNILWGIPVKDKARLEQQARYILQQGSSHPLWNWICRK